MLLLCRCAIILAEAIKQHIVFYHKFCVDVIHYVVQKILCLSFYYECTENEIVNFVKTVIEQIS